MSCWLRDKAVDDWRRITRRWSFQLALASTLLWSILGGLVLVWSAFEDLMPKGAFIVIGILLNVSIGVASLLKQPGAE